MSKPVPRRSATSALLTSIAVTLTLITAYIHLSLGGLLFVLNGLGYLGLATLVIIGAVVGRPIIARYAWLPRVALGGYAGVTIVSYLIIGPYFPLGWIAKGVEIALMNVVAVDLIRAYDGPAGVVRAALGSLQIERRTP